MKKHNSHPLIQIGIFERHRCRSDKIMARILSEKSESSLAPIHSFCGCTTIWRGTGPKVPSAFSASCRQSFSLALYALVSNRSALNQFGYSSVDYMLFQQHRPKPMKVRPYPLLPPRKHDNNQKEKRMPVAEIGLIRWVGRSVAVLG